MAKDKKKYYRNRENKKFSQRFLRKSKEDAVYEIHGNKVHYSGRENDNYWNPYSSVKLPEINEIINIWEYQDGEEYFLDYGYADSSDCFFYNFKSQLTERLFKIHHSPLQVLDHSKKRNIALKTKKIDKLEYHLFELFQKMNDGVNSVNDIALNSLNAILLWDEEKYIYENRENNNILTFALFAPFWVNKPSEWDADSNITQAEFVFGLYSVPPILKSIWYNDMYESSQTGHEAFFMYILFAQGGSLKKFSKYVGWNVSKKEFSLFHKIPVHIDYSDAFLYASILNKGGSENEYELINSYGYRYYHHNQNGDLDKFIEKSIDWLMKYRKELSDDQFATIFCWANHEKIEAEREGKKFYWKGRKPKPTLQKAEQYYQLIYKESTKNLFWDKHNFDWVYTSESGIKWQFVELTSSSELNTEGFMQHHCISGYDESCNRGHAAIISLRIENVRKLTIEIQLGKNSIRQVRGKANRLPTEQEKRALTPWIKEKDLKLTNYIN